MGAHLTIDALIPGNVTLQLYPVQTSLQLQIAAGGRGPKGDTAGLEVAESPVDSGIDTRVLFNNSGVLGEYAVSGSGDVAMTRDRERLINVFDRKINNTGSAGVTNALRALIEEESAGLYFPSGTYLMDVATSSGMEERAIGPYNLKIADKDGYTLVFEPGVEFIVANGANLSHIFHVFNCANFRFLGYPRLIGNNAGLSPGQNNGGLFVYCTKNFEIEARTEGFQGSHVVGNWQFNGVYRVEQDVPALASGFDIASCQDIDVYQKATGAGSGTGFHHIIDPPNMNPDFNTTGVVLRGGRSNNVRMINPRIQGFATGVSSNSCDDFFLRGGVIEKNGNVAGNYGCGVALGVGTTYLGDDYPDTEVFDCNISGTVIRNNGGPSADPGLSGGIIVNSTVAPVRVIATNAVISDNADSGIVSLSTGVKLVLNGVDFRSRDGSGDQTASVSGTLAAGSLVDNCPGFTSAKGTGRSYPDENSIWYNLNGVTRGTLTSFGFRFFDTISGGYPGSTKGKLALAGETSGEVIVQAPATASGTLTLPSETGILATQAYAASYSDSAVTAVIAGAPSGLNTLDEIAAAINDDPNFATTVANSIATKAPLASPAFTGQATFKRGSNPDSSGQPSGTWAQIIYNATNSVGENGLLVKNNYAASGSTIFEVGVDLVGGAYLPWFKVLGDGDVVPGGDNQQQFGSAALNWEWGWFRNITLKPASSVTPANNGELTFQATSNTSLTFKFKGSDGTVRSGSIALA